MQTGSATDLNSAGATLQGSWSGASGTIADKGFYWGTTAASIQNPTSSTPVVALGSGAASGSMTGKLTSLQASTTYYYRAFVVEYDASQQKYVDRLGDIRSFTTSAAASVPKGYLGCYEMPAVSTSGSGSSGAETYGDKWYLWNTSSSNQKVVTHTYKSGGKVVRNYTCMVDKNKKAPIWSAFVMHDGLYPDDNVGRSGSWTEDPAIPSDWQQTGVSGYSKGHFVASNYRQNKNSSSGSDSNKQTFYYTNQAPQFQNGFNDGVWNTMELAIKDNAPSSSSDTLYVVVGVLYEDSNTSNGVPVPSHFYTCLMKCHFSSGSMTSASGCAYIYTNESHAGEKYGSFITSIDAVEARAGFDFFANVPASLQSSAESSKASLW